MWKSVALLQVVTLSLISVANATEVQKKKIPQAGSRTGHIFDEANTKTKSDRWSGSYVGAYAGLQRMGSNMDNRGVGIGAGLPGSLDTKFTGYTGPNFTETAAQTLDGSSTASVKGKNFGFTWGANRRMTDHIVIGLEFDIAKMSGETDRKFPVTDREPFALDAYTSYANGDGVLSDVEVKAQVNWLSTLRGRAGLLLTDDLLIYGTGGLAIGQITVKSDVAQRWFSQDSNGSTNNTVCWTDNVSECSLYFNPVPFFRGSSSHAQWRVGYALGGGAEYALSDQWSAKLDYIYYSLGTADTETQVTATAALNSEGYSSLYTVSSAAHSKADVSGQIVRLGINYKF